jgi:hypothetical protein
MPPQIRLKEDYSGTDERRGSTNFFSPTLHDEFGIEILEKEKPA